MLLFNCIPRRIDSYFAEIRSWPILGGGRMGVVRENVHLSKWNLNISYWILRYSTIISDLKISHASFFFNFAE